MDSEQVGTGRVHSAQDEMRADMALVPGISHGPISYDEGSREPLGGGSKPWGWSRNAIDQVGMAECAKSREATIYSPEEILLQHGHSRDDAGLTTLRQGVELVVNADYTFSTTCSLRGSTR